jgi:hypothetical protein
VRQLLVSRFGYAKMIWYLNKTCLLSLAGGLFSNPLATYMGYPPKALRTGFGVEGIAIIDPSSYDIFLLSTWVTI